MWQEKDKGMALCKLSFFFFLGLASTVNCLISIELTTRGLYGLGAIIFPKTRALPPNSFTRGRKHISDILSQLGLTGLHM